MIFQDILIALGLGIFFGLAVLVRNLKWAIFTLVLIVAVPMIIRFLWRFFSRRGLMYNKLSFISVCLLGLSILIALIAILMAYISCSKAPDGLCVLAAAPLVPLFLISLILSMIFFLLGFLKKF